MIKYLYSYNATTKETTRTVGTIYPGLGAVELAFTDGTPTATIHQLMVDAYQGIAEEPYIMLEEAWWAEQYAIQQLVKELATVTELQLTTKTVAGVSTPLTLLELATNKAALAKYRVKYAAVDNVLLTTNINNKLTYHTANRTLLEDGNATTTGNPWLKAHRGVAGAPARPVATGAVPVDQAKRLVVIERDATVRDVEDTLADLAKMNSLLFSMVSALYTTASAAQKNKIPAADKAIIDYAVTKFGTITTRADMQLAVEGTALVDKLYQRETDITNIVKTYMP